MYCSLQVCLICLLFWLLNYVCMSLVMHTREIILPVCFDSVRQKCLDEQKRRRQRATKKISTFIGTFMVCFTPYVITRWGAMYNTVYGLWMRMCVWVGGSRIHVCERYLPPYCHQKMWRFLTFFFILNQKIKNKFLTTGIKEILDYS